MIVGEDVKIEFSVENSQGVAVDLNLFINVKATLIEKKSGDKLKYYSLLSEVDKLPIYKDILTFRLYIDKTILQNKIDGVYILEVELYISNAEITGGVQIIKEVMKLEKLINNEF